MSAIHFPDTIWISNYEWARKTSTTVRVSLSIPDTERYWGKPEAYSGFNPKDPLQTFILRPVVSSSCEIKNSVRSICTTYYDTMQITKSEPCSDKFSCLVSLALRSPEERKTSSLSTFGSNNGAGSDNRMIFNLPRTRRSIRYSLEKIERHKVR